MKKITAILLAALMTLALTACAGGKENTENIGNAEVAQNNKEESQTPGTTPDDAASEQGERKILVAYFSATNNTEGTAGIRRQRHLAFRTALFCRCVC